MGVADLALITPRINKAAYPVSQQITYDAVKIQK